MIGKLDRIQTVLCRDDEGEFRIWTAEELEAGELEQCLRRAQAEMLRKRRARDDRIATWTIYAIIIVGLCALVWTCDGQ